MAINSYFFNAMRNSQGIYDRVYNAQDVTSYLDKIVGSGVFPNPSTNLQVMANSGFNIIVKAGSGWINGHKMVNSIDYPITLANSDVLLDRIDRVVFYVDYSLRTMGIDVLQGTPATNPSAPAITRNETRVEYSLATISVKAQAVSITQANITDTRGNSSVCGWVQGLIQQVSTDTLFTQWQTAFNDYYADVKQQLDDFMATLTQELRVNTYIKEYRKTITLSQSDSKIVPLDMQGYTYEQSDVIFIFMNGLEGLPDTDYLIDTRYTPPQVHLNFTGSANTTEDVDIRILKSAIGIQAIVDNNGNEIITDSDDSIVTNNP